MWGNSSLDSESLRQVCDWAGHLLGDGDLAPVDEVHQEAEGGEGDVIEDDNGEIAWTSPSKKLREVRTAGAENNLVTIVR